MSCMIMSTEESHAEQRTERTQRVLTHLVRQVKSSLAPAAPHAQLHGRLRPRRCLEETNLVPSADLGSPQ